MSKARRTPRRNARKAALALGAAGFSLALTGGASATAPADVASRDNSRQIFLGEEEIADVSLASFHVFDRESESHLREGITLAAGGCGHGGGAAMVEAAAVVATWEVAVVAPTQVAAVALMSAAAGAEDARAAAAAEDAPVSEAAAAAALGASG